MGDLHEHVIVVEPLEPVAQRDDVADDDHDGRLEPPRAARAAMSGERWPDDVSWISVVPQRTSAPASAGRPWR